MNNHRKTGGPTILTGSVFRNSIKQGKFGERIQLRKSKSFDMTYSDLWVQILSACVKRLDLFSAKSMLLNLIYEFKAMYQPDQVTSVIAITKWKVIQKWMTKINFWYQTTTKRSTNLNRNTKLLASMNTNFVWLSFC